MFKLEKMSWSCLAVRSPNVEIGDNSCLFPSVTIYSDVKIGNDVTIHSGTRIGTDGFGYVQLDGEHKKLFHLGNVVIEDEVEIEQIALLIVELLGRR